MNVGFAVGDIATTIKKIVDAEGKIIKDKFKFDGQVGYIAVFQDSFGNEISLFSEN